MEYAEFLKQWYDSTDSVEVLTSGSTGRPKEILLPKADMLRSAAATVRQFGLTSESTISSLLPMASIATRMAVVRSIVAKCRYLPVIPSNDFVISERIDLLSVGPSQTDCLIRHPEYVALVDVVMVGGAPLSQPRLTGLLRAGYDVYESYGMTETCSNVALRTPAHDFFRANEGISFSVDCRDCLCVQAPGYSFDGLQTNDVVELLSPTTFRLLGRADNAINSGGLKIHPEMLEKELSDVLEADFYIAALPHDKWGETPLLVVEGDASEVLDCVRKAVLSIPDRRCRPRYYAAVSTLPRTSGGKIKRIIPDTVQTIFI